MPSPRRVRRPIKTSGSACSLRVFCGFGGLAGQFTAGYAQIMSVTNIDGRKLFVNSEPPV